MKGTVVDIESAECQIYETYGSGGAAQTPTFVWAVVFVRLAMLQLVQPVASPVFIHRHSIWRALGCDCGKRS